MSLAKALKRAFDASELSIAKFAERVGVSTSTAHGWLHGTHGIKADKLPAVARALNVDVAELQDLYVRELLA